MPYNLSELALLSQQNTNDTRNIINTPFWNNIVRNNNQTNTQVPENMGLLSQYNDLFASMLQNNQSNNLSGNMLHKQQPTNFNMNQLYPQNVNKTSQVNILREQNPDENKCNLESQSTCEAFMKDFQSKTFNMLYTQSRLLNEIKEKNDTLQGSMAHLINEVSTLK